MDIGLITVLLFVCLLIGLMTGLPITFVLGSIGILFSFLVLGPQFLFVFPSLIYGKVMLSFALIAVPLFIMMGVLLQESGIAERLFNAIHLWMGRLRGGLAAGTVVICTLFAAMAGIGGAATVTMGLVALPAMLSRNYDKKLALGCIGAGGALGILIPPSVVMIIYGMITMTSIGKLFAGGVFPGLLLSSLFILYIIILSYLKPEVAPSIQSKEKITWKMKFFSLKDIFPVGFLIAAVLGSIFGGLCTPSEGAAIGVLGAVILTFIYRGPNLQLLKQATYTTIRIGGMVMWIIIGAYCFATTFTALGGAAYVRELILAVPLGYWGVFIVIQIIYFVLGMLLDPGAIVMITAPVTIPIILTMGYDPVWFGIIFIMNMQMSYITPPFGYNLFYLKGVAPEGVVISDIYLGIIPFVFLQAIGLVIVTIFPQIAMFLPNLVFGT